MKYLLFAAAFCLLIVTFAFAQTGEVNIVPKPKQIRHAEGSFSLNRRTKLYANTESGRRISSLFNEFLQREYGYKLKFANKRPDRNFVSFEEYGAAPKVAPNSERYALAINPEHIRILGEENGLFYGLQTIIQMLPETSVKEPLLGSIEIIDEPRFAYRGMHLDVARHFMPVEFVKKFIDLMSQYKFNYFHWHLTEDQGWRIEIKKYPKLTEIGSKRPETVKERNLTPYIGDGVPVEGFYTQEQIKDVVAYAKARYITVVPEIELPGHASAALAAYPQFGCKADYKYKVQTTWGIFKEVFCPTDETFKFLEDVIDETISLFPDSPYIHIGGDEVLKDHWKESPFVQDLMKRENLKDEHEVQSYFIRRIEKHINKRGKKIIGWDEILEGGLAPNATVMSWRGMKGGIEAAKAKHDVIMTPTDYVYFDYGQGDPAYEPLNIGSYVPLEKVYSFEPVPKELSADEAKYVIGGQANIWTEYMKTPSHVEYMAFPRMLALSEVLWSKAENKNFADFNRRLAAQFPRLDAQKVNYRIPEPGGLQNIVTENEKVLVELKPASGTVVIYTTDGSPPDVKTSEQYYKPIEIKLNENEVKTLKTIVITPTGRKSSVYAATILRGYLRDAAELSAPKPGLNYRIETGLDGGSFSGETRSLLVNQFERRTDIARPFELQFTGYFTAPADGVYEFQVETSGRSSFRLGDAVITIDSTEPRTLRSVIVPLRKGAHLIELNHSYRAAANNLRLRYGIKGQGLRQAYGGEFVH